MNVKKTQAMVVRANQVLSQEDLTLSVFCCDRQLSSVHSYKYLGVVLDSKLTWAPHMEHLIRKVSSKIGVLYRSSKKLSTDAKRQYYYRARKIFSVSVAELSRVPFFWSHFLSSWSQSCAKTRKFRRKKKAIFEAILCTHPDTNIINEMIASSNQILFSFISDKDRRTDSQIRRKNTAQFTIASSFFWQ